MAKTLPTHAELVVYNHAVAGHDGTLCDADGELFIKPCTPDEIAFYESAIASYPKFVEIMPTYFGTLSLEGQLHGVNVEEASARLLAKHRSVQMEKAGAMFLQGDSYDSTEPSKLLETSQPVAALVTKDAGLSSVGNRIPTNQAIVLENASHGFQRPNILDVKLGRRLWADDASKEKRDRLDEVTAKTTHRDLGFRISGMRVWRGRGTKVKDIDQGYQIYDKAYGQNLNKDNIHEAFRNFIFVKEAGVDDELGKFIAQAFYTDVMNIQKVLQSHESRMFSASLLFVFEGDGDALRSAMEEASRSPPSLNSSSDYEAQAEPKIYVAEVIDFAHAKWTPGEGCDENSLLGVRSVAQILKSLGGA